MKEERRLLQTHVFPELEKFCEEKGARFQAVDLRWGVNEESQLNQKTLAICLNEIARCQRISPKPNFLILLGNKYGWQPIPTTIPQDEMNHILSVLTAKDRELLDGQWYRLDTNAIPPEYVLQPRGKDHAEYKVWEKVETEIREVLRVAVSKLHFVPNQLDKYFASATHQEILKGALNHAPNIQKPEEHVLAVLRHIDGLPDDTSAEGFIDLLNGKPDSNCVDRLNALRTALQTTLGDHCSTYAAKWNDGKSTIYDPATFVKTVYDFLSGIIQEEMKEIVSLDEINHEVRLHEEFRELHTEHFCGREDILTKIRTYLNDSCRNVFSMIGDSGSGKSSVMAKAILGLQTEKDNTVTIFRFIGTTATSSNIISLLRSVCGQIAREFNVSLESLAGGGTEKSLYDMNILSEVLRNALALSTSKKPVVIFLDALDQLSEAENAKVLYWIPRELPENAKVVVSSLPELEGRLDSALVEHLQVLRMSEAREIVKKWSYAINRTLTEDQYRGLIDRSGRNGLPMYLKLAFERTRAWHSYDKNVSLHDDVRGIMNDFFAELEAEHTRDLVEHVICYMLCGKYQGLAENEILEILVFDQEYWNKKFLPSTHPEHRAELVGATKIPIVVWSRLFLDLEPFLSERDADGVPIITFFHRQFVDVLSARYHLPEVEEEEVKNNIGVCDHWYSRELAGYFEKKPLYLDEAKKKPNTRKLVELPWQQVKAEMWDEATESLCDLDFIQAKCAAGMTHDLVRDCQLVLDTLPERQPERRKEKEHEKRVGKYAHDLIAYSKGENKDLDIIQTEECWSEERIKKHIERMQPNPTRADRLQDFVNFIGREAGHLRQYAPQVPDFALQQAWNHASNGPVGEAASSMADKRTAAELGRLLRRSTLNRPPWNPLPQVLKTLTGHTEKVKFLAVSLTADGKRAVSGSSDGTSILWDLASGQALKTLTGHANGVTAVNVTPDGKCAVSGFSDGTCILWDLESGKALKTLVGHTEGVTTVSVTPDGKRALSGSRDNTCILWDLESGQALKRLKGHTDLVYAVSMTADGRRAVSGSSDGICILWDLDSGQTLKTLTGHANSVTTVSVTPDGKHALSGYIDSICILWDLESGLALKRLEGHTGNVNAVSMTPDSRRAVSGSNDKTCILWDLESGRALKTLTGHTSMVEALSVTPDGKRAFSSSYDGTCILWDLESGQVLKKLTGHTGNVYAVSVTPDGKRALSGSLDNTCILWDLESGQTLGTLVGHTDQVKAVSVTPDGKRALSGSYDNTCILWDLEGGQALKTLTGHASSIWAVSVTPDGKRAVSGSSDGACILWDLEGGKALKTLTGHTNTVTVVSVTPDGKCAVSGSFDGTCILWDLESGQSLRTRTRHMGFVFAISMTPDGNCAVSGSSDGTCILWDLKRGQALKKLKGHTNWVYAVSVTPDGKRAVSGSKDNTCILWDLESGQAMKTLIGHTDQVYAVSVTPDGRRAISGSWDNTCIVWDLESGKMAARFLGPFRFIVASIFPKGIFGGGMTGDVAILHASRELLCPGAGVVTVRHIWEFEKHQYVGPSAECPFCGNRFQPQANVLDTIRGNLRNFGIGEGDLMSLLLPHDAWEEPKLSGYCPQCGEMLKFNPFIA